MRVGSGRKVISQPPAWCQDARAGQRAGRVAPGPCASGQADQLGLVLQAASCEPASSISRAAGCELRAASPNQHPASAKLRAASCEPKPASSISNAASGKPQAASSSQSAEAASCEPRAQTSIQHQQSSELRAASQDPEPDSADQYPASSIQYLPSTSPAPRPPSPIAPHPATQGHRQPGFDSLACSAIIWRSLDRSWFGRWHVQGMTS